MYGRHLPELRGIAEAIIREVIEEDSELRWVNGDIPEGRYVSVEELDEDAVEKWLDGSRINGRAAAATRDAEGYLGTMATVADAEELGVSLAWEKCDVVALDIQGVISWIQELMPTPVMDRGETDETNGGTAEKTDVGTGAPGSGGERGGGRQGEGGSMVGREDTHLTVTPAGIRQAFPLHPKAPAHLKWARDAIKWLTYLITDKGPQRQWLAEIGKTDDSRCVCDGWTPQNAAHLYGCPWIGDGVGRPPKQAMADEGWCAEVARFLR